MESYKELPPSETLETVHSLIPYLDANEVERKKSIYLSYRFTGFAIREAIGHADISESTLRRWREVDSKFVELEAQTTGPDRAKLKKEVINEQFIRNFRRVLDMDGKVIEKMHYQPDEMTKAELDWMGRMRSHYTATQMELLERILDPNSAKGETFDQMLLYAFRQKRDANGNLLEEERIQFETHN